MAAVRAGSDALGLPALLAWGQKVSPPFRKRVREIAEELEMPDEGASWLMACMAFETGESFDPGCKNAAGSGAVGLIQFMPATARELDTTPQALEVMSGISQLEYVRKYFAPYRARLRTLSDCYMAILWPRGIGKPEDYALWNFEERPTTYRQNSGLDINSDTVITKAEAASKVQEKLTRGLRRQYAAA